MDESNPHYKEIVEDPRYADGPSKEEFPMFESLKLWVRLDGFHTKFLVGDQKFGLRFVRLYNYRVYFIDIRFFHIVKGKWVFMIKTSLILPS